MTDLYLRILLQAQNQALSVVKSLIGDLTGGSGLSKALAGVAVAGAGMAVALGVDAVKKASDFQNAMLQNVAHAGLAKDQFNAVSQSVLQMSSDVGQMPTDLAQGLYPILSGFSGITNQAAKAQTSLEDLRLAAEDVAGTETKTTVTSGALTAAYNALGLQTNDTATNISRLKTLNDEMEATIIAGNMHWDTYANVVGKLSTAIKGTSVSFTEASAGLATMTNEGFTAQRSQTYLANLFTQLDLKTDSLAKNAKKLGVTFDENKFKTMSLSGQLDYLTQITGGNNSEVLKLLNSNATALKTYNALESGMKTYKSALDSINNSQGATNTAFATASSSFQMAGQRMKATIDVLLIDLGTQLLPILTKLLDWVTPLIKQFANWVLTNQSLHQWLSNVGGYLQNTLIPTVVKIGQAVFNFAQWMTQGSAGAQALGDALKVVGVVIVGVKLASWLNDVNTKVGTVLTSFGKWKDATGEFLTWFKGTFFPGFDQTSNNMKTSLASNVSQGAAEAEAAEVGIGLQAEKTEVTVAASAAEMKTSLAGVLGLYGALAVGVPIIAQKVADQAGPLATQIAQLKARGQPIPPYLRQAAHDAQVPGYASGGPVLSTGLALVHQGEYVIPAGNTHNSSIGGHTFNISLVVNNPMKTRNDLMTLVDELEDEIARRFRSQTGNYATGGTF